MIYMKLSLIQDKMRYYTGPYNQAPPDTIPKVDVSPVGCAIIHNNAVPHKGKCENLKQGETEEKELWLGRMSAQLSKFGSFIFPIPYPGRYIQVSKGCKAVRNDMFR